MIEECEDYILEKGVIEPEQIRLDIPAGTRIGEFRWDESRQMYIGRHVWVGNPDELIEWGEWGGMEIRMLSADQLLKRYDDSIYKGGWLYDRVVEQAVR